MSLSDAVNTLQNILSKNDKLLSEILAEMKKLRPLEKGFTFSKVYLKRLSNITASAKAVDGSPDYQIYSLDTDVIIKSIALVPDNAFKTHGIILIEINGVPFLEATTAGDFTDLNSFTVPLPEEGFRLQRSKKIKFFVWTDNGTASALTITALVSKDVKTPS